ncbi:hypothetical protein F0919_05090 [Taibaiella lutea]|uniref:Uncharacterized protein n=1 Tax=Taibaiella lutea TaxID=2608001 RepID=A0A5M6CP91_9BACT|nr:hypothetical protein [Taibaiella lutea]KAA5537051.1 hypothetical protein F0919_05090 [Taibaiella lutea]
MKIAICVAFGLITIVLLYMCYTSPDFFKSIGAVVAGIISAFSGGMSYEHTVMKQKSGSNSTLYQSKGNITIN